MIATYLSKWQHTIEQWIHQKVDRPNWDEYFLLMAMLVATRSIDAQWQAGAVLVKDKKIIGTGYNSFPRDMPDELIPNIRPYKYDWVIHAEVNAVYNAVDTVDGSTCYTNGHPCIECLKALYNVGIKKYIITPGKSHLVSTNSDNKNATYDHIVSWGNIQIQEIKLDYTNILQLLQKIINQSNGANTSLDTHMTPS